MILTEDQRRNRDRRMPRAAIKNYKNSPFEFLYNSLNDQVILNATGHNHRTFNILIKKFSPNYQDHTFDKGTDVIRKKICYPDGRPIGRKRDMSPVGCLGLVLMWYRSTGGCTRSLDLHLVKHLHVCTNG